MHPTANVSLAAVYFQPGTKSARPNHSKKIARYYQIQFLEPDIRLDQAYTVVGRCPRNIRALFWWKIVPSGGGRLRGIVF